MAGKRMDSKEAEQIRVLLVEPGEKPRLVTIPHTLDKLREIVGGTIQAVYPWEDAVALVCNDEGKLNGMLPNRMLEDYDLICGTFFICGLGAENFESISDEMAQKYTEKFLYPELFMRTLDGHVLAFRVGSGEKPIVVA